MEENRENRIASAYGGAHTENTNKFDFVRDMDKRMCYEEVREQPAGPRGESSRPV